MEMYKVTDGDKILVWRIEKTPSGLLMTYGQKNGTMSKKRELIRKGLANRTLEQQIESRYDSRIAKQYKRGYKFSLEDAYKGVGTNGLGLPSPMLAHPLQKVREIDYSEAYAQPKLNGHRCVIGRRGGKIFSYSKEGNLIETIDHILSGLEDSEMEEEEFLDGELYCHGASLQQITSWAKRKQANTLNLKFHAYDMASISCFSHRYSRLKQLTLGRPNIDIVETVRVYSREEMMNLFYGYRKDKYEGLILRWGEQGYENKRTSRMVKVKAKLDAEFEVIDIFESKDGLATLTCKCKAGTFNVLAPGTMMTKKHILENKERFIGKMLTVEYADITDGGIPYPPVAKQFRVDL